MENTEKIRLICRMCLKCNDLVNIFSESIKSSGLWRMINVHLGQNVSEKDDMPEFICLACIKIICDFDSYCIRSAENQEYLRKNFTIVQLNKRRKKKGKKPDTEDENDDETQPKPLRELIPKPGVVFPPSNATNPNEKQITTLVQQNEPKVDDEPEITPRNLLNNAPLLYLDEVLFPVDDDIGADYAIENPEADKQTTPQTPEQQITTDSIDEDDEEEEEARVEAVVTAEGENVNEIFHNYCTSEIEPCDENRNIPEHMKPIIDNYPKMLMKDGRIMVRSWRLNDMLNKFYSLKCNLCPEEIARKFEQKNLLFLFNHYKKTHATEGYVTCCDQQLFARNDIIYHMVSHVQPSAFKCSICGKKVAKPSYLIGHMKCHKGREEEDSNNVRCDECGVRIRSELFLEMHKTKVHKMRSYRVTSPERDITEPHPHFDGFPKSIIKNGELVVRREKLNELLEKFYTFRCDLCPGTPTFQSFKEMLHHYSSVHSTKGYAECCGEKFRARAYLISHMARHLDPDAFTCPYCGKTSEMLNKLREHIMTHKPAEERAYFCTECPKRYASLGGLQKHMITHIPRDQRKQHLCKVCGKIFHYYSSLQNHVTATHKNQEFVCHVCGKMFKNIFLFKQHSKRHETGFVPPKQKQKQKQIYNRKPGAVARPPRRERAPSRPCLYCPENFSTKRALIQHVDLNHDCIHICPHCPYSNRKFDLYLRHTAEKHILDRKFVCKICGAQFEYISKLNYHMNGHTKEKIHRCQFCGKEYISLSGLCRHKREFHNEEYNRCKGKKRQTWTTINSESEQSQQEVEEMVQQYEVQDENLIVVEEINYSAMKEEPNEEDIDDNDGNIEDLQFSLGLKKETVDEVDDKAVVFDGIDFSIFLTPDDYTHRGET